MPQNDPAATFCVLAVEPDAGQARMLEQTLEGRIHGKLIVVGSTEAALEALVDAIPDLVLVSPLLPPRTEDQFVEHLRVLGVDASHLQLLSIPRFGENPAANEKKRTFGSLGRKISGAPGRDPVASAFADEVAAHLARLSESRGDSRGFMPLPEELLVEQQPGVRLEHLEGLLERLEPDEELDEPDAPQDDQQDDQMIAAQVMEAEAQVQVTEAQVPVEPASIEQPFIHDVEDVAMPTAQEFSTSQMADPNSARLPRFLTLDSQISPPLRAVLDEADGCLKMAFLTGGGACASRALDMLLSEQGIVDTNRAHQLRELGKKHPAVAESFLRMLLQVMNDSSALWDVSRLTLAIVLLKAIAHEIYVLGPERTERATYVLALLERFNSGSKGGSAA